MMATPGTGLVGIFILFALLIAGTPIGVALGLVGIGGLILVLGIEPALIKAGVVTFDTLIRYELGTLPLFMLIAQLLFAADASKDLFDAAAKFVGHRRGGLALASVAGCAGFGTINGSSLATTATIGMVALPEMRRRGYSDALATGTVAAGGTLGQLIPPSGALIVFGIIAEQSIGQMFTAAIIPGLTQALFYLAVVWLLVLWRPSIAPRSERAPWSERIRAMGKVSDMLLLIVVVITAIAMGWMSPSEAASVGAAGSFAITIWRRSLSLAVLHKAFTETLRTSGMILQVILGALIFSVFIGVTGVANLIADGVAGLGLGTTWTLILIALLLLILGSVLDGLGLMLLTTPILLPIVQGLGMSPIWFGIFIIRAMEIGFVHPPLGLNLYVIHDVMPDVTIRKIFKGVLPFLASDLIHLLLLILFPIMAMGLPHWLGQ